jgi:hypothetical protein
MRNSWDGRKSLLGLFIFLTFLGAGVFLSARAAQAAELKNENITSFGMGKVKVRLYTDYFCVPCRAAEPRIESLLKNMVAKNLINITFIDTPFHQFSSVYAKYFLFVLNENRSFENALSARAVLFEAAKESMAEKKEGVAEPQKRESTSETTKLEDYLKQKGVKFTAFDVKPVFTGFERYLREDKIDHTPSCAIERSGRKEMFIGGDDIAKALESLAGGSLSGGNKKPSTPKETAK